MAQITIPTWSKERSPTGWALSFHVKCKFAERTWGIELRYSQLQRLHIKLLTLIPTVPGRKALADRFPKQSALRLQFLEPSIPQINRRRIELERYLQYVAEHAPPRVANEMTKVLVAAGKLDMQTRRSWPRQMDSVFVPPETHSTEDACPEDGEEWEFVDGADAGASAQSVQSAPREPARTASAMLSPADIEAILSQLEAEARQAEARLVQAAAEPGTQQLMRADRDDGVAAVHTRTDGSAVHPSLPSLPPFPPSPPSPPSPPVFVSLCVCCGVRCGECCGVRRRDGGCTVAPCGAVLCDRSGALPCAGAEAHCSLRVGSAASE